MKESTAEKIIEPIALYLIVIPITAWFAMLWHGALADNLDWQTYGYWVYYQLVALGILVSGVLGFAIALPLQKILNVVKD